MVSWRSKARLQRLFSALPLGHRINYVFQRHVTHGEPISDATLASATDVAIHHVERMRAVSEREVTGGTFYEFGAGWDLHVPQILWCLGVEHQTVVDIRPLVRPDLVAAIARRLAGPSRVPEFVRVPTLPDAADFDLTTHLVALGIDYRAPCDARETGIPDRSIDFITSTNTLEHIPPDDIRAILAESHRILADDGLMSFQIDYKDHYAYFDRSISIYNFLTFTEDDWRRWSPSLHFQNRLRHVAHRALVEEAGFEVLEEVRLEGDAGDLEVLRTLPLAPEFADVPIEELAVRGSQMVLAKRRS